MEIDGRDQKSASLGSSEDHEDGLNQLSCLQSGLQCQMRASSVYVCIWSIRNTKASPCYSLAGPLSLLSFSSPPIPPLPPTFLLLHTSGIVNTVAYCKSHFTPVCALTHHIESTNSRPWDHGLRRTLPVNLFKIIQEPRTLVKAPLYLYHSSLVLLLPFPFCCTIRVLWEKGNLYESTLLWHTKYIW